jgi:hypothetical protein
MNGIYMDRRHPLLRTWRFDPGAHNAVHEAMSVTHADAAPPDTRRHVLNSTM